jgi:RNA polymerase sigma factor (sigma-70 family)
MTDWHDESGPLQEAAEPEAQLFESVKRMLVDALMQDLDVPEEDAEQIAYDGCIEWYALNGPPSDTRTWLITAVCLIAKRYLEQRGVRDAAEKMRALEERILRRRKPLVRREALQALPARARQALRLRHVEKKSYAEIAEELGVSERAAQGIVAKAMAKLRRSTWR